MSDKLFIIADGAAEAFAKLVLILLFIGCTVFLTVSAGPVGLAFFFVVLSFARWVSHKAPERDNPSTKNDR